MTHPASNATTRTSVLIFLALALAFFARVLTALGLPALFNFAHFAVICALGVVLILTSTDKNMLRWIVGLGAFLGSVVLSAVWNEASPTNVILYFIIMAEPFLLIAAITSRDWSARSFERFKMGLLLLLIVHLLFAYFQWLVFGYFSDDVKGLFLAQGAGHHVAGAFALTGGVYFLFDRRRVSLWTGMLFVACLGVAIITDSKQMIAMFVMALIPMSLAARGSFYRAGRDLVVAALVVSGAWLIVDSFFSGYLFWLQKDALIAGIQQKLTVFPILTSYFDGGANFLFGLGPGHSVGRVALLIPENGGFLEGLGVSVHPVTQAVTAANEASYISNPVTGSSLWALATSWVGVWGDLGFVGLAVYASLWAWTFNRIARDRMSKYLLLTLFGLGAIFLWMEEPGFVLFVATVIGLRYQRTRIIEREQLTVQQPTQTKLVSRPIAVT